MSAPHDKQELKKQKKDPDSAATNISKELEHLLGLGGGTGEPTGTGAGEPTGTGTGENGPEAAGSSEGAEQSAITLPDGAEVLIVDGSGQPAAHGIFHADTGTIEQVEPEITVVEETHEVTGQPATALGADNGDSQSPPPVGISMPPGTDPLPDPRGDLLFKYYYTWPPNKRLLATQCHAVGFTYRTLLGARSAIFQLRFDATTRTPDGAAVNPEKLQRKTREKVDTLLLKYAEEAEIILSLSPFAHLGGLESLSDTIVIPILAQLFQRDLEEEFRHDDEGERVRIWRCA
jgi:hypothetical protein